MTRGVAIEPAVARADAAHAAAGPVAALAAWLAALTGRRRYVVALLLGALAAATLPPVDATPLLWPAFTGLIWLYDGVATRRAAFALGWWFGFGFFLAGLYWVGISMLVDPARFGWMIPFAVGGLSAGMALFPAAALWLMRLAGARGAGRVLALAAAWTAGEWLRGHVLTGFPWNLIGYAWTVADAPLQLVAATGIYGLSLVTVVIAALPAAMAGPGGADRWVARRPWLPVALALGLVVALWGGGALRLAQASGAVVPGVTLRIVQPNIAEQDKWDPAQMRDNLRLMLALSDGPGIDRITDLVWPEAAVPCCFREVPELRTALARAIPQGGLMIAGAVRRAPSPVVPGVAPDGYRYYNSVLVIDHGGKVLATYDKAHLVPFGEYVPLRGILPIQKLTPGLVDFSTGPGPRTLDVPRLPPFSPLICYEAIFPDAIVDESQRPRWLLNVTNDAWFGRSSGPHQHFESARTRAIEEGLPLVRAANTGISGVVDAYGRVTRRLGLEKQGVIDAPLPVALAQPTLYARFGDALFAVLLVLVAGLAWLVTLRRRA